MRRDATSSTCTRATTLACLVLAIAPACAGFHRWPWGTTQRAPAPMKNDVNPLPPGDSERLPPGPEEVLVLRHADPVQVRPAGLTASFPLSFYNKSLRVNAGSGVSSAPGGRVEVLWPGGNSIVLFGRSSGVVGSPSRGEPAFLIRQVERAQIDFNADEQVELLGGARLSASTGPFILDHVRFDILRVKNQSKGPGRISFREALLTLDPGQVVDLPLLASGAAPVQSDPGLQQTGGAGFRVAWSGQVDVEPEEGAVRVRALGEHELVGLGLHVRMLRDEEALFLPHAVRKDAGAPATPVPPTPTSPNSAKPVPVDTPADHPDAPKPDAQPDPAPQKP